MELLTVNLAGKARRASLAGRPFLVVPMTLIVPGVLNGSRGPLLYPPDECRKDPGAWNHMPIVVNHPTHGGAPVSARRPDVLERSGVGFVFNAAMTEKLAAEGWFDIEKTRRVDPSVLASLEAGRPVELSTGLFLDDEPAPEGAVFNSPGGPRPYVAVARNLKPDHLAVLPGARGACSIADGCGVLVNRESGTALVEGEDGKVREYRLGELVGEVADNELSFDDVRQRLCALVGQRYGTPGGGAPAPGGAWVTDVFDDYLVYQRDGKNWQVSYSKDPSTGEITLDAGDPVEVVRVTEYVPASEGVTGNARKPSAGLDITPEKACQILKDGAVRGKPLTPRQRGLFGVICGRRGKRKMAGNEGDPLPAPPAADPAVNTADDDFQTVIERIFNAPPPAEGTPESGDLMALRLNDADRDRIIKELVGNCHCHQIDVPWKGQDAAALARLDDPLLNTMYLWHRSLMQGRSQGAAGGSVATGPAPAAAPPPPQQPAANQGAQPLLATQPVRVPPPPPPKELTEEEWLALAPPKIRPVWNSVVAVHNQRKTDLMGQILGNLQGDARDRLAARLQPLDIGELEDWLLALPPKAEPQPAPAANWFGAAAAPVGQPPVQEEPLGSPVYNFDRRSA